MVIFWAVVVAIGILNHVTQHISALRMVQSKSTRSRSKLSNLYTWALGSITTPATFGDRCAQKIGWGTVPPRIQSLTLVAFLLVNIALSIHGYRITPENM